MNSKSWNPFEISIVLIVVSLLVAMLIPQLRKTRHREAANTEAYNRALGYQQAQREREEESRSIVRLFKDRYFGQVADAIYWAEGGATTRYPYGIKSVLVQDAAESRLVCLHTIKNSWERYEKTDCDDFIAFLGSAYCPESADLSGHVNWLKNVRYFIDNPKPLP